MGAPLGSQNALGNSGGKSLNDRKLAAAVRNLTLAQIFKLLSTPRAEMSDFELDLFKQVFIKLSGTVLPRLTEVTGEDGDKLTITISKEIADKNGITDNSAPSESENNSAGQPPIPGSELRP